MEKQVTLYDETKTAATPRSRSSADGVANSSTPVLVRKAISRNDLQKLSQAYATNYPSEPESEQGFDASLVVENTFKQSKGILDSIADNVADSFKPIVSFFEKSLNVKSGPKQIIAALAGVSMFATALAKGAINIINLVTGKSNGRFNVGEILFNGMLGWFGYDAMQYAQGKNNNFDNIQNTLKSLIPLALTGVFNGIISNPNSASYKMASLVGLRDPIQSLTNSLLTSANPATYFGNRAPTPSDVPESPAINALNPQLI